MYDVCVVGGGIAGMTAAITAARQGKKVILIEKNNKLGKKIYATGNGRCNLTNTYQDYKLHYNSSFDEYIDFLNSLSEEPCRDVLEFVDSLGVLTTDNKGYVYPASMQASSFVWAMIDELNKQNVKTVCNSPVKNIEQVNDEFLVSYNKDTIRTKNLVLACGGKSYAKLGGTDLGYELAESIGHSIVDVKPSLCGLITKEDISYMAGVRISGAKATLYKGEECISEEGGELQLTEYGLSGIMIFNLSSKVGRILDTDESVISLDLIYKVKDEAIENLIKVSQDRTIVGFLNSFINDKAAVYFVEKRGINTRAKLSDINMSIIKDIIKELRDFRVSITATKDFDNAQVCSGGVDLKDISYGSCMSKHIPNLYMAGEMLDIDGVCGGYNITFGILTGIAVGKSIYDKN
ncbi:MAG: aminoacetone oxidase family FAD-binding enzyme [Lachnospiraceae bacterium]|nr:aminoacetone oxidase family FAD-binding enzyme [Lachnospiraceae bacterium]